MDILVNIGIVLTYISIVGSVGLILFFAVKEVVKNFKEAKSNLIGLSALIIIFIIAYILASSADIPAEVFEKTGVNIDRSKIIGSGIIVLYLIILGIIGAIIYSQVSKFIKK